MELRVLGPLEVVAGGLTLDLGAAKQQVVLGVLLLHPNEVVSAGRLVDEVWGEAPPPTASKVLQGYVSGLRRILGGEAIATRGRGYLAVVPSGALDAERFEELAARARAAAEQDPARAVALFKQALSLWRGDALAGLDFRSLAAGEVERLAEQRLGVVEQLMEVELTLGADGVLVPRLRELVAAHPYREKLRAQLMLALYRSGRQAEALAVYHDTRRLLSEELGVDPGPELRRLAAKVLEHAEELEIRPPPATAAESAAESDAEPGEREDVPETRRLVTVLTSDVAGNGAPFERLDPELLHHVLDSHARVCAGVVGRHGGSLERLSGHAVAGVFGLREIREDDALRAVSAAVELRDELGVWQAGVARDHRVTLTVRLGVESGEVYIAYGDQGEPSATGHVFSAAALLQRSAPDGGILLGDQARRLVEGAALLEPHPAADGPRAWRLSGLEPGRPSAALSAAPFVGRHPELHELRSILDEVTARRACRLVAVLGPPGIGKSRLVRHLLEDEKVPATIAAARCVSYGTGADHRPLPHLLRQVLGEGDPRRRLDELLRDEPQAGLITRHVMGAIGRPEEPVRADETFWAVRRLLERAAARRPLIVVIDDVHWAQPELLDLLDYLVTCSTGAPILLLCLARPELPAAWATPRPGRDLLTLGPLGEAEAYKLAEIVAAGALDRGATADVVDVAEGNPFFLEQLIAARVETGTATTPVTVQAVLAARIGHLEPGERAVLQYGAVEGVTFHRGAVAALLRDGERAGLGAGLMSLVRKNLIRADRPAFADEDAFRCTHALIGEAAYDSLPKRARAGLHERLADWLKGKPGAPPATIGHHLETCVRLRAELGLSGEPERALAREASQRLAEAAPAALLYGDVAAGARLWERAVDLLPPGDGIRTALLPRLGAALHEAGRFDEANRVLAEAIGQAGEPRVVALAEVERERVRLQSGSGWVLADTRQVAARALTTLRGDDHGRCRAWCLRASADWTEGRAAAADESWRRAEEHALRAADERELYDILGWRASAAAFGPMPVTEALELCARIRERVAASPAATAVVLHPHGLLLAMRGEFGRARESVDEANEILGRLGRLQSAVSHHEAMIELLAGRPAAAEVLLRAGYDRLADLGERTLLATTAAMLARALHLQGRDEEAERACRVSERNAGEEDIPTQVMWRGVQARVLAARGEDAEPLARAAVRLAEPTDLLPIIGDALSDLAVVLDAAGSHGEACAQARRGLDVHGRKGNTVSAGRLGDWLAARQ
ncbi:BTAD domain-containing putative transcriptional regulator [Nonomuraea sp. NPDC050643]|uniref:BTAD domain-containing putative transcriptional regulator n=1 Tax=Nonomuraea sp. NPDC050643 TaxID=3155660 RepID=UPI003401940A